MLARGEAGDAIRLDIGRRVELGRDLRTEGEEGAFRVDEDTVVGGGEAPSLGVALRVRGVVDDGPLELALLLRVDGDVSVAVVVVVVVVAVLVEARVTRETVGGVLLNVLDDSVDVPVEVEEGVVRRAFDEEFGDLRRGRRGRRASPACTRSGPAGT